MAADRPAALCRDQVAVPDIRAAVARETCDGSSECAAFFHIHGCFADNGNCDHPKEHHG